MILRLHIFVIVSSVVLAKAVGETVNDELLISTELSEVDHIANELYKKGEQAYSDEARQVKGLIDIAFHSDNDSKEVNNVDVEGSDGHNGTQTESNETSEVEHILDAVHNYVQGHNDNSTHVSHTVIAGHIEGPADSEGDENVDHKSSKQDSKEAHMHIDSNDAREFDDEIFTSHTDKQSNSVEDRQVVSKPSESHIDMLSKRLETKPNKTAGEASTEMYKEKEFNIEQEDLMKNLIKDLIVIKSPNRQILKRLNSNTSDLPRSFKRRSKDEGTSQSIEAIETSEDLNDENFFELFNNKGFNLKKENSEEAMVLNAPTDDFLAITHTPLKKYDFTDNDKIVTTINYRLTTEEYEDYYDENKLIKEEASERSHAKPINESTKPIKIIRPVFTERTMPEMLPSMILPKHATDTNSTRFNYDISVPDIDQPNIQWDYDYKPPKSTEHPTILSNHATNSNIQSIKNTKKSKLQKSTKHPPTLSSKATNPKALNYDFSIADIDQPKAQWIHTDEKVLAPFGNNSKLVIHPKPLSPTYDLSVAEIYKPDVGSLYTDKKKPAQSNKTKGVGYPRKESKRKYTTSTEKYIDITQKNATVKPEHQHTRVFTITKVTMKSPTKSSFNKSSSKYSAAVNSSVKMKSVFTKARPVTHISHYSPKTFSTAQNVNFNSIKTLKPNSRPTIHQELVKKYDLNKISDQTITTTIPFKTSKITVSPRITIAPHDSAGTEISAYHHKYVPGYIRFTKITPTKMVLPNITMGLDISDETTTFKHHQKNHHVAQLSGKGGRNANAEHIFSDKSVTSSTTSTRKSKNKSYNLAQFSVIPLTKEPTGLKNTTIGLTYDKGDPSNKKLYNKVNTYMNTSNSTNEIILLHQALLKAALEALQKEPWEELAKISNKNTLIDEAVQILFDKTFRHSNSTENHVNNTFNTKLVNKITGNNLKGSKLVNTTKERYVKMVNKQILNNNSKRAGLYTKAKDYVYTILNNMITKSYLNESIFNYINSDHLNQTRNPYIDTFFNKSNVINKNKNDILVNKKNYHNKGTTNHKDAMEHIRITQTTTYRPVSPYQVSLVENTGITKGGFLIRNKYIKTNTHNLYPDYNSVGTTKKYISPLPAILVKLQKNKASQNDFPDHNDKMTPSILNDVTIRYAYATYDQSPPEDNGHSLFATTILPMKMTSTLPKDIKNTDIYATYITYSTEDEELTSSSTTETANLLKRESQNSSVAFATLPKSNKFNEIKSFTIDDEKVSTTTEITSPTSTDGDGTDYDYDMETTTVKTIRHSETLLKNEKENNSELTVIPYSSVTKTHMKILNAHESMDTTNRFGNNVGTLALPSKDGLDAHKVKNVNIEQGRSNVTTTHIASVANKTALHTQTKKTYQVNAKNGTEKILPKLDKYNAINDTEMPSIKPFSKVNSLTTENTKKLVTYVVDSGHHTTDKEKYDNVTDFTVIPYNISQKQMRTSANLNAHRRVDSNSSAKMSETILKDYYYLKKNSETITVINKTNPSSKILTHNDFVSSTSVYVMNTSRGTQKTELTTERASINEHRKEEPKSLKVLNIVIKNPIHTKLAAKSIEAKDTIKKVGFNFSLPCKERLKKDKNRPMSTLIVPDNSLKVVKKYIVSLNAMGYNLKPNKTKLTKVMRPDEKTCKTNQNIHIQNLRNTKLQMNDTILLNKTFRIFQVLHNVSDLLFSIYEKLPGNDLTKSNVTEMVSEHRGDMHSKLLKEFSTILNDSNLSRETTVPDNGTKGSIHSAVSDKGIVNLIEPHILKILQNVSSLLDSIHKKIPEHDILTSTKKSSIPLYYKDVLWKPTTDVSKTLVNERPNKALLVSANNVIKENNIYDTIISKLTTEKINEVKILKVLHNVSNILVSINDKIPEINSLKSAKKLVMLQPNVYIDDTRVINHSVVSPESDFHKRTSLPVVSTTETTILKSKTHINTTSDKVFDSQSNMILEEETNVENLGIVPDIEKLHTEIISEHIKKRIGVDPNSSQFNGSKKPATENFYNESVTENQKNEGNQNIFSSSIANKEKSLNNKITKNVIVPDNSELVHHALPTSVASQDTTVNFNSIWMEQGITHRAIATGYNNWPLNDPKTVLKQIESGGGTVNQDNKNNDFDIASTINIPKDYNEKVRNKISSPKLNAYFDSLVKKLVFNQMSDSNKNQLQSHVDGISKLEERELAKSTHKEISLDAESKLMPIENELLRNIILNSRVMNNLLDGVSEATLEKELSYQQDHHKSTLIPYPYNDLENSIQNLLRNENFNVPENSLVNIQDHLFQSTTPAAKLSDNTFERGLINQRNSRRMPIKPANLRRFEQMIRKFFENRTVNTQLSPKYNQPDAPTQNYLLKTTTYAPVDIQEIKRAIKKILQETYVNNNQINQKHYELVSASTTSSPANYQNLHHLVNLLILLAKQPDFLDNLNTEHTPILNPLFNNKLKSFSRLAQKSANKPFHSRPIQDVLKQSKTILSWRKLLLCLKKELVMKGKNYMNCFLQSKTPIAQAVTPVTTAISTTSLPASTTMSFAHVIHELKREIEMLKKQTKLLGTENLHKYQYSLLPFLRVIENVKDPYSESDVLDETQSPKTTYRPISTSADPAVLVTPNYHRKKDQRLESTIGILNKTKFETMFHNYKLSQTPLMVQRGSTAASSVFMTAHTTDEMETSTAVPVEKNTTTTLTALPKNSILDESITPKLSRDKHITPGKENSVRHKVVPLPKTRDHGYRATTGKTIDRYTHHFFDPIPKEKGLYKDFSAMQSYNDKPVRKIASSDPVQLRLFTPVEELDKGPMPSIEAESRLNVKPVLQKLEPLLYVLTTPKSTMSHLDFGPRSRPMEFRMHAFTTTAPSKYSLNSAPSKNSMASNLESTATEPAINVYSMAEQGELSDPTALMLPVQKEAKPEDQSEEELIENVLGTEENISKVCGIESNRGKSFTIERYPWYGVLMYPKYKSHSSTSVILVTREFVIASALDIDKFPKHEFRRHAKVVLGRNCTGLRIGVLNYNYHPDFSNGAVNTLALIQIDSKLFLHRLRPICSPPSNVLLGAHFVAIVLSEECRSSKIMIYEMEHVPLGACRKFYRENNQDSVWPKHFACGRALRGPSCMWRSGASLVLKQNKRWHLLGFGVEGPGCGAPSRFIDFGVYWRWVARAALTIGQPAVTTVAPNHIILRRAQKQLQRHGPCDPEERRQMLFTDSTDLKLPDDNNGEYVGKALYNLTIFRDVAYTCIDLTAHNVRGEPEPPQMDLQPCYADPPRGSEQIRKMNFCLTILFKTAIKYKIVAYGQPRVVKEKKKFKRTHHPAYPSPAPKDTMQPETIMHRYRYMKSLGSIKMGQSNIYNAEGRVVRKRKYEKKVRQRSVGDQVLNRPQKVEKDGLFSNEVASVDYVGN